MKQRYRAKERERLVEAVMTTGAPIKEVAERIGVKVATAYFWVKRARQRKSPQFAMVVPAAQARSALLRVEIGGAVVHVESGFDDEVAARCRGCAVEEVSVIAHGLPVYVALEPVGMRFGYERLGGIVRERMRSEPRTRALFVFVGKRGHTMKVLTWDGTGSIVVHKKLDAGKFELPTPTRIGDRHVIVSDAIFEVIFKGVAVAPKAPRRRIH